jgi:hypothetical protein
MAQLSHAGLVIATINSAAYATHSRINGISQNLHMMLGHTIAMRQGPRIAAIAALLAASVFTPTPLFADPTPTPSPEVTRSPFEQYKIDREIYLEAIKIRSLQIRVINNVFKERCDKAARDFKNAMSIAKSLDQKNLAASLRKNAVSAAIVARDAAINLLGPEPIPPVEPAKPLKFSNKKKQR